MVDTLSFAAAGLSRYRAAEDYGFTYSRRAWEEIKSMLESEILQQRISECFRWIK